jgi:glutamate dehydrogenase (NAD(P)+)
MNELADKRRKAAEKSREEVIRRNMRELIDLLVADADTLPCEAAEKISIRRVARRESDRTAAEIMIPIPTIHEDRMIREAAALLVESSCSILAVVSESDELVGIVTDWDVTRSTAEGISKKQPLKLIMSRDIVLAEPAENLLSMLSKLETHEISALPVVENGKVLGMVSASLLARRTLLHLLQSQS